MKKTISIISFILIFALVVTPVPTSAASKITVSSSKITLYDDGSPSTKKIYVSCPYEMKATYSSTNEKICKVSNNGKITAIAPGTAYIETTVNYKKSGEIKTKILKTKVTVKSCYVSKTEIEMGLDESYSLKIHGTKIESSTSSDTKVCIVTDNIVYAVSPGNAIISSLGENGKAYRVKINVESDKIEQSSEAYDALIKLYQQMLEEDNPVYAPSSTYEQPSDHFDTVDSTTSGSREWSEWTTDASLINRCTEYRTKTMYRYSRFIYYGESIFNSTPTYRASSRRLIPDWYKVNLRIEAPADDNYSGTYNNGMYNEIYFETEQFIHDEDDGTPEDGWTITVDGKVMHFWERTAVTYYSYR